MDQTIIELYDDYVHHHFDRRPVSRQAGKIRRAAWPPRWRCCRCCNPITPLAVTVAEDDRRIRVTPVSVDGATGPLKAYLAAPADGGKHGAVLVVHQNRGLNPHIEDIARRLATVGYVAMAVDFLSPLGGTPPDENAAMQMFAKLESHADHRQCDRLRQISAPRAGHERQGRRRRLLLGWRSHQPARGQRSVAQRRLGLLRHSRPIRVRRARSRRSCC